MQLALGRRQPRVLQRGFRRRVDGGSERLQVREGRPRVRGVPMSLRMVERVFAACSAQRVIARAGGRSNVVRAATTVYEERAWIRAALCSAAVMPIDRCARSHYSLLDRGCLVARRVPCADSREAPRPRARTHRRGDGSRTCSPARMRCRRPRPCALRTPLRSRRRRDGRRRRTLPRPGRDRARRTRADARSLPRPRCARLRSTCWISLTADTRAARRRRLRGRALGQLLESEPA